MSAATSDESPVRAVAAEGRFATRLSVPGGEILADEPLEVGGGAAGPTPYQLLSAALAACTSMTLRLYAGRKGWSLPELAVEVAHSLTSASPPADLFTRRILLFAPLPAEQEAKLLEMADRCPVHRTLAGGGSKIVTETTRVPPPAATLEPADPPAAHWRQMEQCAGADVEPKPL
jgi:putative redox protein